MTPEELKKIVLANLQLYHGIIAKEEFKLESRELPDGGTVLFQDDKAIVTIPYTEIETEDIDFEHEW